MPRYAALRRRRRTAGRAIAVRRRSLRGRRAGRRRRRHRLRRPVSDHRRSTAGRSTAAEAERSPRLVEAAWTVLDRVAAAAPAGAPQGPARRRPRPRQDGRPRRSRPTGPTPARSGITPTAARPDGSRRPSRRCAPRCSRSCAGRRTGRRSPAASGRRATPPRRIAWHALDHAWEIEDRTDPATG